MANFRAIIDAAQRQAAGDTVMEDALEWRNQLRRLSRGDRAAVSGYDHVSEKDRTDFAYAHARMLVDEDAAIIARQHGETTAEGFLDVAIRGGTPILQHLDAWLKEGGVKGPLAPRTAAQYRADLLDLAEWAKGLGITTVEGISDQVAGKFVTGEIVGKGVHWATGNRKITAASSYWRWLRKRAGIKATPWAGQSLSKGRRRNGEKPKRPFTEAEVIALLTGDADTEMADAMRVAGLSGMRLDELYRLTVADCAGGWFVVNRAKTDAGIRRLPIHSDLAALMARRIKGKRPDAYLFDEAGPARDGRERSMAISKRFGRYRQRVGVHDRVEGVRHSRVDFHSWRRTFISLARNAGVDVAVVAAVVGHEAAGVTDSVYTRIDDAALRVCVQAVRLPVECIEAVVLPP